MLASEVTDAIESFLFLMLVCSYCGFGHLPHTDTHTVLNYTSTTARSDNLIFCNKVHIKIHCSMKIGRQQCQATYIAVAVMMAASGKVEISSGGHSAVKRLCCASIAYRTASVGEWKARIKESPCMQNAVINARHYLSNIDSVK
jgi:hypothetical protein